jgi:Relaxase/Mobilisation nuclease domain/Large polyvalent protein-associated domain 7
MIGKIAPKGRGFRGLLGYLMRHGRGHIVAGPMAGRTTRELASEFGALRRLNPKLGKAVAHLMLSPAPGDPSLTDSQWQAIAQRYVEAMGFADAPWIAFVHQDTDHQHMHIAASRIGFDGKTISDANDFRKSEAIVRKIEADFGLIAVPSSNDKPSAKKKNKKAHHEGDNAMPAPTIPPNPFDPSDPQYLTWPHAFEPGRDAAELALVVSTPSIVVPGAGFGEPLSKAQGTEMRRPLIESDYPSRMQSLFGGDLTRVYRHSGGATLYFKQQGRIADLGHTLNVFGGMEEQLAAQRIVAMGRERGWKTITFTGGANFVELAMREALNEHFNIVAKGPDQEAILAKLMAERQGAMGTVAAPVPLPPGAVAADEYNDFAFKEIEDFIQKVLPEPAAPQLPPLAAPLVPKPAPPPVLPKQPQLGTLPHFLNMRERLQERRDRPPPKGLSQTLGQPPHKSSVPKGP